MTEKQSSKLDFEKLMSDIENGMRDMGRSARRIAEFLYSNTDEAALLSTAEVAQACHVHSSSVVRFAQTLGFSGYKQLQGVLKTQYKSNLERLETLQSSEPIETSGRRFSIFVLAD